MRKMTSFSDLENNNMSEDNIELDAIRIFNRYKTSFLASYKHISGLSSWNKVVKKDVILLTSGILKYCKLKNVPNLKEFLKNKNEFKDLEFMRNKINRLLEDNEGADIIFCDGGDTLNLVDMVLDSGDFSTSIVLFLAFYPNFSSLVFTNQYKDLAYHMSSLLENYEIDKNSLNLMVSCLKGEEVIDGCFEHAYKRAMVSVFEDLPDMFNVGNIPFTKSSTNIIKYKNKIYSGINGIKYKNKIYSRINDTKDLFSLVQFHSQDLGGFNRNFELLQSSAGIALDLDTFCRIGHYVFKDLKPYSVCGLYPFRDVRAFIKCVLKEDGTLKNITSFTDLNAVKKYATDIKPVYLKCEYINGAEYVGKLLYESVSDNEKFNSLEKEVQDSIRMEFKEALNSRPLIEDDKGGERGGINKIVDDFTEKYGIESLIICSKDLLKPLNSLSVIYFYERVLKYFYDVGLEIIDKDKDKPKQSFELEKDSRRKGWLKRDIASRKNRDEQELRRIKTEQ